MWVEREITKFIPKVVKNKKSRWLTGTSQIWVLGGIRNLRGDSIQGLLNKEPFVE